MPCAPVVPACLFSGACWERESANYWGYVATRCYDPRVGPKWRFRQLAVISLHTGSNLTKGYESQGGVSVPDNYQKAVHK